MRTRSKGTSDLDEATSTKSCSEYMSIVCHCGVSDLVPNSAEKKTKLGDLVVKKVLARKLEHQPMALVAVVKIFARKRQLQP